MKANRIIKNTFVLFMFLFVIIFENNTWSTKEELPQSMASIGDSITAGAVANMSIKSLNNPFAVFQILFGLTRLGLGAGNGSFDINRYSWSTGINFKKDLITHAERLKFLNGPRKFKVFNASVSGSTSHDMYQQATEVIKWSQNKLKKAAPDFMTILVGGNDVCRRSIDQITSPDVFEREVSKSLELIKYHSPSTKILISTIPDVTLLKKLENARVMFAGPLRTCKQVWDKHKFCMTVSHIDDEEEKQIVREKLDELNARLVKIANSYERRFPNTIKLSSDVYDAQFEAKHMATDCFHPNVRGHNLLSKLTWEESWWAEDFKRVEENFSTFRKRAIKEFRTRSGRRKRGLR